MQSTPIRAALLTSAALVATLAIGCANSGNASSSPTADTAAPMSSSTMSSTSTTQSPPPTVTSDRALPSGPTGTDMSRNNTAAAAPMSDEPAPRPDRN